MTAIIFRQNFKGLVSVCELWLRRLPWGRFSLRSSDRKADLQALDSHSPALVRHELGQGLHVLSCLEIYLGTRKREKKVSVS